MQSPSSNPIAGRAARVLVVGAGVSGLTSALCLRRDGFHVTVVAEQFAPDITSVVAGALWEWPPAVCGHHNNLVSLARSKSWSETSYAIFTEMAGDPSTGVFLRPVTFYFDTMVDGDERHSRKMNELAGKVAGFRHDPALIAENGVAGGLGLVDAYTYLAPMIDTDAYMAWLLREVRAAGVDIVERRIEGSLLEGEPALLAEYDADLIVNCAGLGARELANDAVYPMRGAIIRVLNDGSTMPRITQAHCISHDGSSEDSGFIFIVPRGENMLVLGGFAEPDEWDLEIGLHNYEPVRRVYQRCVEFLPSLAAARIDDVEPVRAGLRPFRDANVRLEGEPGARIVHNYGHGGSGITFSWGCSRELVELVREMVCIRLAAGTVICGDGAEQRDHR